MEQVTIAAGRGTVALRCNDGPCKYFLDCVYAQTRKEAEAQNHDVGEKVAVPYIELRWDDGVAKIYCRTFMVGEFMEDGDDGV